MTGLLDFIEHLARWAQGPITIVALARPELLERRPSWAAGCQRGHDRAGPAGRDENASCSKAAARRESGRELERR